MIVRREARLRRRPLYAWFDASGVDAMKSLLAERVDTVATMVHKLYETPAHAGALFDLGLSDNEAQQLVWQKTSEMPFDPASMLPGQNDPTGPTPEDEATEDGGVEETVGEDDQTVQASAKSTKRDTTQQQLAQIYMAWRSSWSGLEKAMAGRVRRHFNSLRPEVLGNIEANADQFTPASKGLKPDAIRTLIGELLFDLTEANGKLIALSRPLLRSGLELGGKQATTEHAQASGQETSEFNIADPEVSASLRRREIQITDSNRTLRRRLANQIAAGIEAGETASKVSDRVRKEFNLAATRANTIARTEIGRAVEEGRAHGRHQAGTPLKSWLWSRKETGRPWHMDTEAQTLKEPVANDEDFTVAQTGNTCPHPRATNDPEDDINCGCTTIARFPGDSIKAVVDRYTRRGYLTFEQLSAKVQDHEPETTS